MTYLGYFFPMSGGAITAGAIVLIIGLSVWNSISLRTSANTQNRDYRRQAGHGRIDRRRMLSLWKARRYELRRNPPATPARSLLGSFGIAMVAALWAYDGWISVTFVGGEVREPQKFLPKSLSYSVLMLIVIYVVVNFAYMNALPLDRMASTRSGLPPMRRKTRWVRRAEG